MDKISSLNISGYVRAMVYKFEGDDGLLIEFSHGRMEWYRVDTKEYISVSNYSYWIPA